MTITVLPQKYGRSKARSYLKRRLSARQKSVPMEFRRTANGSADMPITLAVAKKKNLGPIKYFHFESRFSKKALNMSENVKYDRVELYCAVINRSRARDLPCFENRLLLRLPGPCSIIGFFL
jgi:hypothetical protein